MKTKKSVCLILIMFFFIGCWNNPANNKTSSNLSSKNLLELIRTGYNQVNDASFSKVCKLLNDSILEKSPFDIQVISEINLTNSTIDWGFWYMDLNRPSVRDRLFFYMDISKGENLSIQDKPAQISDIQDLARDYIFYPDSMVSYFTLTKRYFDSVGEIETSKVMALLRVNIAKGDGFSIDDWKYFFNILSELIKLCENERNKMSLELWMQEYSLLPFEKQKIVADIIGYHIMIMFY